MDDALLRAAVVLGPEFSTEVLAEMLALAPLAVMDRMAGAVAEGVIGVGPTGGSFTDRAAHGVAYAALPPSERARLHGLAADGLIRLSQSGRLVEPTDIAAHLLAAGPAGASRATAFLVEAGDRQMKAFAYERARHEYRRAAANLASAGGDDAEHAGVLVALGEACLASGARAQAGEAFRGAVAPAHRAGRADLLARAALGLASGATGIEVALVDRAQRDLLEEALAALPPGETAWRAALTARLSVALSVVATEERRAALAEEAVSLARRSGSASVLGAALAARCDAMAGPAHVELRRGLAEDIVELGRSERDAELELAGRRLRLVALAELGDFDGVDAEIRDFSALTDVMRQPAYGWYVPLWRGMRALMEGRIPDCRRHLDDATALGARAESHNALLLTATLRWVLVSECAETEQIDIAEIAGLDAEPGVWPLVVLAVIAAEAGRLAEALTRLDSVAPRLARAPRDSEWLPMLAQVAGLVGHLGGHPVAAWTYEALLPFAPLFVVEGVGAAVRGSVRRHLGVLAAALGRYEDAEAHFAAALDIHRALGAPLLVAGTLQDWAAAFADEDRLAEARRLYEQLGIRARLRVPAAAAAEAPTDAAAGARFARDGDIWELTWEGRTVRLYDAKGLHDLARLLAQPGRAFSAVELSAADGFARRRERPGDAEAGLSEPGHLGPILDQRAVDEYRNRLQALQLELDEAEDVGDGERAALAQIERDALVDQLTAAYGLGGRRRRAGDPAERARTAVTARIRNALRRIEAAHPALGGHLRHSVRTGTVCSYEPEHPVSWRV